MGQLGRTMAMALRKAMQSAVPLGSRSMCSIPEHLKNHSTHKFDWGKIKASVSADTYSKFVASCDSDAPLDKQTANELAKAMQPGPCLSEQSIMRTGSLR